MQEHPNPKSQRSKGSRRLEKERTAFERAIAASKPTDENRFDLWRRYVKWTKTNFPGKAQENAAQVLSVLERVTDTFKDEDAYKNERHYVRFWLEYANMCEDTLHVLHFMRQHSIGLKVGLFWRSFAVVAEHGHKLNTARDLYLEALALGDAVTGTGELQKQFEQFNARMETRRKRDSQKRIEKESETESHSQSKDVAMLKATNGRLPLSLSAVSERIPAVSTSALHLTAPGSVSQMADGRSADGSSMHRGSAAVQYVDHCTGIATKIPPGFPQSVAIASVKATHKQLPRGELRKDGRHTVVSFYEPTLAAPNEGVSMSCLLPAMDSSLATMATASVFHDLETHRAKQATCFEEHRLLALRRVQKLRGTEHGTDVSVDSINQTVATKPQTEEECMTVKAEDRDEETLGSDTFDEMAMTANVGRILARHSLSGGLSTVRMAPVPLSAISEASHESRHSGFRRHSALSAATSSGNMCSNRPSIVPSPSGRQALDSLHPDDAVVATDIGGGMGKVLTPVSASSGKTRNALSGVQPMNDDILMRSVGGGGFNPQPMATPFLPSPFRGAMTSMDTGTPQSMYQMGSAIAMDDFFAGGPMVDFTKQSLATPSVIKQLRFPESTVSRRYGGRSRMPSATLNAADITSMTSFFKQRVQLQPGTRDSAVTMLGAHQMVADTTAALLTGANTTDTVQSADKDALKQVMSMFEMTRALPSQMQSPPTEQLPPVPSAGDLRQVQTAAGSVAQHGDDHYSGFAFGALGSRQPLAVKRSAKVRKFGAVESDEASGSGLVAVGLSSEDLTNTGAFPIFQDTTTHSLKFGVFPPTHLEAANIELEEVIKTEPTEDSREDEKQLEEKPTMDFVQLCLVNAGGDDRVVALSKQTMPVSWDEILQQSENDCVSLECTEDITVELLKPLSGLSRAVESATGDVVWRKMFCGEDLSVEDSETERLVIVERRNAATRHCLLSDHRAAQLLREHAADDTGLYRVPLSQRVFIFQDACVSVTSGCEPVISLTVALQKLREAKIELRETLAVFWLYETLCALRLLHGVGVSHGRVSADCLIVRSLLESEPTCANWSGDASKQWSSRGLYLVDFSGAVFRKQRTDAKDSRFEAAVAEDYIAVARLIMRLVTHNTAVSSAPQMDDALLAEMKRAPSVTQMCQRLVADCSGFASVSVWSNVLAQLLSAAIGVTELSGGKAMADCIRLTAQKLENDDECNLKMLLVDIDEMFC